MRLRALRDACLGGFLFASLLYGTILSLVHVAFNHLGSTGDALLVYSVFLLLYGLWGAAFFGLAGLVRPRNPFWGLFAFNLVFWEIFFLYGLTYDQVPLHPDGRWGMAGVLLLLAAPIAMGAGLASWLLARAWKGLRWAAVAALLLGIVAHVGLAVKEGPKEKPPEAEKPPRIQAVDTGLKVVFVGFDGADWRVIRPMMAKGELPTFTRLVEEGTSGSLSTIHDSNSAVIWASIYSGETPERHGVLDFYRIQIPGMSSAGIFPVHRTFFKELSDLVSPLGLTRQIPVDRFSLDGAPLWEVADRAGLTVGVVDGYFYSFPALRPSKPGSFFFSYGLDELAKLPSSRVELFSQPKPLFRQIRPLLDGGDFHWQSAVLGKLLAQGPQPRFVNFYTHEPDSAQHFYWKWYEPRRFFGVTRKGLEEKRDRITGVHHGFDAFLDRLLAQVGPETVVIIASDHGHSPTIVHSLYSQHRHGPPGIIMMRGGPVKRGLALQGADIYDLYPTILYLLGLPVPEDQPGKVLVDALDPGFVRLHPVRSMPTFRTLGLPPNLPGASRDGAMNELEIQKLRSLGYIF